MFVMNIRKSTICICQCPSRTIRWTIFYFFGQQYWAFEILLFLAEQLLRSGPHQDTMIFKSLHFSVKLFFLYKAEHFLFSKGIFFAGQFPLRLSLCVQFYLNLSMQEIILTVLIELNKYCSRSQNFALVFAGSIAKFPSVSC